MLSRIRLLWGKGGYKGADLLILGIETATVKLAERQFEGYAYIRP